MAELGPCGLLCGLLGWIAPLLQQLVVLPQMDPSWTYLAYSIFLGVHLWTPAGQVKGVG